MSTRSFSLLRAALLALLTLCGVSSVQAQGWGGKPFPLSRAAAAEPWASPWVGNADSAARLAAAVDGLGAAGAAQLGLEIRLAPGWHIYWAQPGDAGAPPELDWSGSENLAAAVLSWPAPKRFTLLGLETAGYAGPTVILPIAAQAKDPAQPLRLRLKLNWLACSTLCVPYDAALSLDLRDGPAAPTPAAGLLAEALAQVPAAAPEAVQAGVAARLVGAATAPTLRLRFTTAPFAAPNAWDAFIERPAGVFAAAPQRDGADLVIPLRGAPPGGESAAPWRVVLTQGTGPERSFALDVTPTLAAGAEAQTAPGSGWGAAVLAALLGGLILNVMPCVLPVLSLKLLAVTSLAHAGRREARQGFLFSAAGIVASFLALALVAVGLKTAGLAVGWGMQFQQPLFLAAMAALCAFFTANLWGWVEIAAPDGVYALSAWRLKDKRADAFFGGVAATLLATPCSAPFVGTAVGFALAGGAAEIVTVFVAMGLGLAAPHLLIAAFPNLAARLPRPGAWMLGLRRVLGLGMAGTCAWLLWSLAGVAGPLGAELAAAAAVAAVALLGLRRAWAGRWAGGLALAAAVAFAGVLVAPAVVPSAPPTPLGKSDGPWRAVVPEQIDAEIAQALAAGKIVFVDVTADWCLTCKVNKAAVLDQGWTAERLRAPDLVALRLDWTRPNAAINAYLSRYGRYGVPFNILYGPTKIEGHALQELLTETVVRQGIAVVAPQK